MEGAAGDDAQDRFSPEMWATGGSLDALSSAHSTTSSSDSPWEESGWESPASSEETNMHSSTDDWLDVDQGGGEGGAAEDGWLAAPTDTLPAEHAGTEAVAPPVPLPEAPAAPPARVAKRQREPAPVVSSSDLPVPVDITSSMEGQLSCAIALGLLCAPTVKCSGHRPEHLASDYADTRGIIFKEQVGGRRGKEPTHGSHKVVRKEARSSRWSGVACK